MEEKNGNTKLDIFNEQLQYGQIFADSGMFSDVKSAAQGAVKIIAGRELGLSPIQSQNAFYFVNGKLAIMAQAMAALIKKSGKYDYEIIEHTNEICKIKFYNINGNEKKVIGESVFDRKMAAAAGVINKDVWRAYPMNMMFSRALANGTRWFTPDAIAGFYTVEELQDLEPQVKEKEIVEITPGGMVQNGKT